MNFLVRFASKPLFCWVVPSNCSEHSLVLFLVAHDCGYPLSRYTCRATRVAAGFLDFIAFCRCSTGVALHPLKILVSAPPLPLCAGRCRTEIWLSEKVSRYTGVSQLHLRVSRCTVQLRYCSCDFLALGFFFLAFYFKVPHGFLNPSAFPD